MQGILYEEPSFWLFFLITCLLGGWAAWMTGRACASTWRTYPQLLLYLIPLGLRCASSTSRCLKERFFRSTTIWLM